MTGYNGRERAYRTRAVREEPQRDAVTAALTAQVILCLILAVCTLLMKKFDNQDYTEIKGRYKVMLSDSAQTAELVEKISGGERLSAFFAGVDKFLNGFKPNTESSDAYDSEASPSAEDEPEEEPYDTESTEDTVGDSQKSQIDFDYLKESESLAYTAAGGLFPVNEKDTGEMLPPPKGSTLSPIFLSAGMKPPITGIITSGFSYRYHPLTGNSDFHTGLDVAAAEGTAILAALPGKVAEVGYSQIYGNYIVLQHSDNLKTSYSHCSEIIASEGIMVRQGERIALVGETGTATGPHLHFSVIAEDEFADPVWVLGDYIQLVEE